MNCYLSHTITATVTYCTHIHVVHTHIQTYTQITHMSIRITSSHTIHVSLQMFINISHISNELSYTHHLLTWEKNLHRNRTFVSISTEHFSTIVATYFISLGGFVLSYSMKHKYCIFFGLKSYNKGIIYFNKFQTNVSNSHEIEGVCILITNQIWCNHIQTRLQKSSCHFPYIPFSWRSEERGKNQLLCAALLMWMHLVPDI